MKPENAERAATPVEFDCCECGVHVVRCDGHLPDPRLCAECLMLPGWAEDPKLRSILRPDHHLNREEGDETID